ncbi:MAG: hypothetical protein AAGJ34_05200 [Pseudomonadota bacterium]
MSIDFFYILLGAVAAVAGLHWAKGRNKYIIAGVIGAGLGVVFGLLRAIF